MYIIAFEGIDASGKETQVKMLAEYLKGKGYLVATEHFPRYETPIGAVIKSSLNSEINIDERVLHMLFEADRIDFQRELEEKEKKQYDFLILDRYILSNLAFVTAKGLDVDWFALLQQPVRCPDVTFIFNITTETYLRRMSQVPDRHERDFELLNRTKTAYKHLGAHHNNYSSCNSKVVFIDGNLSVDTIHRNILSNLSDYMGETIR